MKRKITAFCVAIALSALSFTVVSAKNVSGFNSHDFSYAERAQYYNADVLKTGRNEADDMNNTTTQNVIEDFIEDKTHSASGGFLDGIGGISGIVGDVGDLFNGILGGSYGSQSTAPVATYPVNTNNVGYIDPVPAATYIQNQSQTVVKSTTSVTPETSAAAYAQAETVDFSLTANPYAKPTGEIKSGDSGDGVKWIQWMFIYTNYGLSGKDITGVYDKDTEELVKKLQQENGLTADGVVNDEVIDKIELLYYQYTVTATTAKPSNIITAPESIEVTSPQADSESGNSALLIVIIAIALIWCIAIIAVIVIFVMKKKKTSQKNASDETDVSVSETADSESQSSDKHDMSLSDLFEEADKK